MDSTNKIKLIRHPAEITVTVISVIISLAIYALITYFGFISSGEKRAAKFICKLFEISNDHIPLLAKYGRYLLLAVLAILILRILISYFRDIGSAVARDTEVTNVQSPQIFRTFDKYASLLGFNEKNIPAFCLSRNEINIEVLSVPIRNKYCVRIDSFLVFNAHDAGEDYTYANFIIASELVHIALGHRGLVLFLLTYPARLIPLFNSLLYRLQTYSADRTVAQIIGKDAVIKAIAWGENNLDFAGQCLNYDEYVTNALKRTGGMFNFASYIENITSDEPIPTHRIKAILALDERA